ncbi:hypothetical protein Ga0100231_000265 [Opitutaceae bacterium TAV4]|nr:hypothetical protein Ga0100231_000265 [Opitutaceae bacterium TAV4]RRK01666.1 hypothetical protein Ga0100230_007505 [Opitutaceae bacterium TAV3]
MSLPAATAVPRDHLHDKSKFHIFVQIALVLAAITGMEIVLVYLPFAKWLIIALLASLSAVKFLFVIFCFMHLKWDRLFCTILFFIGLFLAGATVAALIALFAMGDSKPLTSIDETAAVPRLLPFSGGRVS